MKNGQALFKAGWFTAGHGALWNCDSTYCFVPYESLPPIKIELFDGKFDWLTKPDDDLRQEIEKYRFREERSQIPARLNNLHQSAKLLGLKLPDSFVKFMGETYLQDRVPSCTACYFDLPDRIIASPFNDGGYLIRFLDDQQWCLLWYLYLDQDGSHSVLVSDFAFDVDDYSDYGGLEVVKGKTFYCAPTFEAFLYRFWIENLIWYAVSDKRPLTKEQQGYINARRL